MNEDHRTEKLLKAEEGTISSSKRNSGNMKDPKSLWKDTKERFSTLEQSLVNCYIGFVRQVAESYIRQGRRVFFRENRWTHWGEGDFGRLVIEGEEDTGEVFGDFIPEITFRTHIAAHDLEDYVEVREDNLDVIKYRSGSFG